MRVWSLMNHRNPLWRGVGVTLLAIALVGSAVLIYRGPSPLKSKYTNGIFGHDPEGHLGTVTEQLGRGRFILAYERILGGEQDLRLQTVTGRLEEPEALWMMKSPSAMRQNGLWTLDGPMDVEAQDVLLQQPMGRGRIQDSGPGLKWDHGVWTGLSPLVWDDLQGQGKGRWILPAGWRRELDGRFIVDHGPVRWEASGPGALRSLVAETLWVTLGFREGRMEQVRAKMEDGQVQSRIAEMDLKTMRWTGPIRFQRNDGWNGEAQSGQAPRPEDGSSLEMLDLRVFQAQRELPTGSESLLAQGARWTTAGLRLEGDVRWEQPLDGNRLTLRAPRILIREAPGEDLPSDLLAGEGRAEGTAVLAWGSSTLSSPRMTVRRDQRTWRIEAPTFGKTGKGTFTAGAGHGNPRRWEFEGPIHVNLTMGGNLRGDQLLWEDEMWTFTGRPATWDGLRERLSGPRMVKKADSIEFPDGIGGTFASPDGDIVIRADRGESNKGLVALTGRVNCQGQGWRLHANRILVHLGPDDTVKTVSAQGAVALQGRIGEGSGEALDLDLPTQTARWKGRVRGMAEVQP